MNSVETYIFETYAPTIAAQGFDIYHVEYARNHGEACLRLFIEPAAPDQTMDIDACETVSRLLSDAFDGDARFPIDGAYVFEVSSPGIERTLYTPAHFKRYVGEKVRIGLYKSVNKKKEWIAVLTDADDNGITLDDDGAAVALEYKQISKAQLYCDF